jgi:hypothetical protein
LTKPKDGSTLSRPFIDRMWRLLSTNKWLFGESKIAWSFTGVVASDADARALLEA